MLRKKIVAIFTVPVFMLGSLQVFAHPDEKASKTEKTGKAESVMDDAMITTRVKAKLLANPVVSSLNVSVGTTKGVVFLKGELQSDKEISAAVQDAHSIEGVVDVDGSGLKVNVNHHPIEDIVTTAKVKGVYIREKLFGDKDVSLMSIHVDTEDGVVQLSGEAENAAQGDNAKKLAESVKGVREVKSTVTVKK